MTNELKECPFHKEQYVPTVEHGFDEGNGNPGSGGYWACIQCQECYVCIVENECATEEQAIELVTKRWNTRHERTCWNTGLVVDHFTCSECGRTPGKGVTNIKFCPYCGSMVIS